MTTPTIPQAAAIDALEKFQDWRRRLVAGKATRAEPFVHLGQLSNALEGVLIEQGLNVPAYEVKSCGS